MQAYAATGIVWAIPFVILFRDRPEDNPHVNAAERELIEALPDDATWQDLLYAIEFRADVEAGLEDAKAGRRTETEELRRDYLLRP